MEKLVSHLIKNPEEVIAILTGKASPIGVSVGELLESLKFISSSSDSVQFMAGFWT